MPSAVLSTSNLLDVVSHYQRSIERHQENESRLLHCITKLYDLPIKVEHLQETGIGKTVNSLRKINGEVGIAAKTLVTKWKAMVAADDEQAAKETPDEEDNQSKRRSSSEEDHDQDENRQINYTSTEEGTQNPTSNEDVPQKSHKAQESRDSSKMCKNNENREEKQRADKYKSNHSSSSSRHNHSASKQYDDDNQKSHKRSRERSKHSEQRHGSSSVQKKTDERHRKEEENSSNADEFRHKDSSIKKNSSSTSHLKRKRDSSSEREHTTQDRREQGKAERTREHKLDREKQKSTSNTGCLPSLKEKDQHRHSKTKEDNQQRDKSSRSEKHKSASSSTSSSSSTKQSSSSTSNKCGSNDVAAASTSITNKRRGVEKDVDMPKAKIAKVQTKVNQSCDESNDADDDAQVMGFDSSMGANFGDVLGMLNMPSVSSKKSKKSLNKSPSTAVSNSNSHSSSGSNKKSEKSTPSSVSSTSSLASGKKSVINETRRDVGQATQKPELLSSTAKLEPLDPSIVFELPTISTNYKPMPLNQTVMDVVFNTGGNGASTSFAHKSMHRTFDESEALAHGISSKTIRTKIYSGSKPGQIRQVPPLFDICIRVLQKNIDALEYTGGVPFEVLRPVLENATPQQLLTFEDFNPYLMEDSDGLWKQHVQRHYRTQRRQEMESWREMFLRCQDEKDRKLSVLAESIKQQQKINEAPVRKTQMAFVDSMAKPPRNVQRRQDQFGTRSKLIATPAARVAALSSVTPNAVKAGDTRLRVLAAARDAAQIAVTPMRPKKAPLMAKTLQFMRGHRHKH